MSDQEFHDEGPSVYDISLEILTFIEKKYADMDAQKIRLALGSAISSIHAGLINSAKNNEEMVRAIEDCADTANRMIIFTSKAIETISERKGSTLQ